MSIERPTYDILWASGNTEARRYRSRVVARTTVAGTRGQTLNDGFSILATYFFGKNVAGETIPMTAPVLQQKASGDRPSWTVQFTLPAEYTFDSLPQPLDERIETRELPEATFAAVCFTGLARRRTLERRERILRELLAERQIRPSGDAICAFYNSPLTPPFMRRNEVLVEISIDEPGPA